MLKNIKYILASAAAVFMLGSCQDFLNTPPVGSLPGDGFYNTPAHIEQGIRGAYYLLGTDEIEENQYLTFSEDRSDNVWVDPLANGIRDCCESSYWRITYTYGAVEALWAKWYELINNVNTVIAGLNATDYGEDTALKNQHRGELLFLRGYAHFELVRTFYNVPIVDKVLSNSEANALKQSPAIDVINNRVLVDLKEAENLLPYEEGMTDANGNLFATDEGRVDKVGVQAMLARVYMTLKGYPFNDANAKTEAQSYLDKVLQYSSENGDKYWAPSITEWKKQFMTDNTTSNRYQIFAIQHDMSQGNAFSGYHGMGLSGEFFPDGGNNSETNGGEMSPVYPEALIVHEYDRYNDPRGEGFAYVKGYDEYGQTPAYGTRTTEFTWDGETFDAVENAINTKWIPFKTKREAVGVEFDDSQLGQWPVNFPILRLEDMMLLRAELYAEDGDVTKALALVNKIRARAGVEERTTSDATEALEYVRLERKLELYMEGIRWFDEVRYGIWSDATLAKYNRYKTDGAYRQGVAPENIYGERWTLPIPFEEMEAVPGLYEQNQDW